jgi:actin-like ATPase involved in cell morphogenesis
MPIVVAEGPLQCVVFGAGQCLEHLSALSEVLMTSSR